MTTAAWIATGVGLFLASLAAHEAGHALVLRRYGFPIAAAGLGLPLAPAFRLKATQRRPFELTLSPWILGAYVMPHPHDEQEISGLPYRQTAWYAGAGVIVNVLLGGLFFLALALVDGAPLFTIAAITAAIALVWLGRRILCAYVMPLLGVPLLGFVGYALVTAIAKSEATGLVGVGQILGESTSLQQTLRIAFAVNIALAATNILPLFPFDGGRIADAAVRAMWGERPARWFRVAAGTGAALLVVVSLGGDVLWVLG